MNDDDPPISTSIDRPVRAVPRMSPAERGAPIFRSLRTNFTSLPHALEELRDLELTVAIELGRVRLPIEEFLRLEEGSVLLLDRRASDPVDVYVNDKLVARGEAVVVRGKLGVRLTEVVSPGAEI